MKRLFGYRLPVTLLVLALMIASSPANATGQHQRRA